MVVAPILPKASDPIDSEFWAL